MSDIQELYDDSTLTVQKVAQWLRAFPNWCVQEQASLVSPNSHRKGLNLLKHGSRLVLDLDTNDLKSRTLTQKGRRHNHGA